MARKPEEAAATPAEGYVTFNMYSYIAVSAELVPMLLTIFNRSLMIERECNSESKKYVVSIKQKDFPSLDFVSEEAVRSALAVDRLASK